MSIPSLFFPYKSRVAVIGSSGSGKTGLLLDIIQYPDFFPKDLKGVYWINIGGIEPNAEGFEIFDKEPNYHLLKPDEAISALENPGDVLSNHILVLDDCFTKTASKSVKDMVELVLKRTANHQNLILFIAVQSTFSPSFDSDLREQANTFMFLTVSETAKFETFVSRVIKAESVQEGRAHSKIIRNLTDKKGYLEVDGPFGIIIFKSSEYKFELWGWGPNYPQGAYFLDETASQYKIPPA